jgi:hypothetical protein
VDEAYDMAISMNPSRSFSSRATRAAAPTVTNTGQAYKVVGVATSPDPVNAGRDVSKSLEL